MSKESIEVLRRGYDAWNRGDYEVVLQMLDPEIEWQFPEGGLNTGIHHGREAVRKFFESVVEAFDQLHYEPEEFVRADDRVVVRVRLTSRGRGSGVELEIRPVHVWTMRGNRAIRLEVIPEQERDRAMRTRGRGLDAEPTTA
jgi:ketosteroid isomerase-like protein